MIAFDDNGGIADGNIAAPSEDSSASAPIVVREMRYPPATLLGDALRIVFGILVTIIFAVILPVATVLWWFILALMVLTIYLLVRTLLRLCTRITATPDGVEARAVITGDRSWSMGRLAWADLDDFRVRHYAARTFYAPLWVEVTIGGPGARIRADHRLDGFYELIVKAWDRARANRIPLDRITRDNLSALVVHGLIAAGDPQTALGAPGDDPLTPGSDRP